MKLQLRYIAIWLAAATVTAADKPCIGYSKYFKGSVPEFVDITVSKSGEVVYKEAVDDERPIHFQIPEDQAAEAFALADRLNHFGRPLESPLKVAHMGIKTFRFEDGATKSEVKFNYSDDADARQLADWFERITETEQDFISLERAVKFDKLGVNQALLLVQMTYERKRLVSPGQFLALLDRVAKNESFMHMSRERAVSLADAFRNPTQNKTDK